MLASTMYNVCGAKIKSNKWALQHPVTVQGTPLHLTYRES